MHAALSGLLAVLLGGTVPGAALAQSYPTKPIRVILPVGPGGGMDYIARSIVTRLAEGLGQVLVIDNRPGAGGDIALDTAARATPDGYTLAMSGASFVVRPHLYKVPYDPIRDFAGISQIAAAPYVLAVHATVPAKSVAELVAHAKASPGKLNYATPGNGSLGHLATELLNVRAGIRMIHVPYKGMGAAFADLLAGNVQVVLVSIPAALPHVKSGRLRALAVTGAARSAAVRDLPTLVESGIAGYEVTQWQGLLAPARVPAAIIGRLHGEVVRVLQQPDAAARLAADGSEAIGSTPQQFAAFIRSENAKWSGVVRQTGIRAD